MNAKKQFAQDLLGLMWEDYAARVPYAKTYQNMLAELGGTFVNDHMAFRTLALRVGDHNLGIPIVKRIWDALGFQERGAIEFPDTHLFARYVQHAEPDFPKIFISELRVDELPAETARLIRDSVASFREILSDKDVQTIRDLEGASAYPRELLERTFAFFKTVPWDPVSEEVVRKVNEISQYGAWVLLHGYNVNHFTGYVNRHAVASIDDIEGLVAELRRRGVPMKDEIEGERGSKLRQTATHAVRVPVTVRKSDGSLGQIEWTYAYMEFAQRGYVEDPATGEKVLFEGFLGPQAKQLFEMTRVK
ncbi:MAG: DUF1338 domain-containing protein [Candidatus Sumerlaeaceae bacterium]